MRFRLSRPGGRYMETVVAGAAAPSFEGAILPPESVAGTRKYIEQMVQEINGSYGYGWYDATAVICRRLMESLIIEIYVSQRRQDEIRSGGTYVALEKLIRYLCSDKTISLGRSTPKGMNHIKELGDTAAHDRTYITQRPDIDDARPEIRKVVSELLILAGIAK